MESGGTAREILEETVSCDTPELYNSGVIYDPARPSFSKT